MKRFLIIISVAIGYITSPILTSAQALEKLCPTVIPLAEEQVGVLFDQIQKHRNIDLKLLVQALNGPQYTLRAYAATLLGESDNREAIPYLIDALSDESLHVGALYIEPGMATTRYRANAALKKLTDIDLCYVWNASTADREQAIRRWIKWYQANAAVEQTSKQGVRHRCKFD